MNETSVSQLNQLKLTGMAKALQQQLEQPGQYEALSFDERLQLLTDNEIYERDHRKQKRLLRQAQLRLIATAQEIDYQHPRGLQKAKMTELLQCHWLQRNQNLLLTGPCGTGKTYIACALAHAACLKGSTTKYYRISRLLMELNQSKADGTYTKKLKSLARINMLILDDWGLEPLKGTQRNDLMEIMDDRHGSSSTVIISQLPTEEWYQSIGDNSLADAILDRLMHNAHRIKLKGESMRKKLSDVDVI